MKSTFLSIVMACAAASVFAQGETIYVQASNGDIRGFSVQSIVKITMDDETMNVVTTDGSTSFSINEVTKVSTSEIDPRVVDLGLSVDWAICSLGAQTSTQLGGRYSWGETRPKTSFPIGGDLYEQSFSQLKSRGAIDAQGNLTARYDAATATLGEGWRMPTRDEVTELRENCTAVWTTVDGVNGQLLTGPNGAQLFLPALGQSFQGQEEGDGEYGMFWTSTCEKNSIVASYTLGVEPRRVNWGINNRYVGLPIRAVKVKGASGSTGNVNPKVPFLYCQASAAGDAQDASVALGPDADLAVYRGIVKLGSEFTLSGQTSEGTVHYGGLDNKLKIDGPAIKTGNTETTLTFVSCDMNAFSYQDPVKIETLGVCGAMTGWSSDIAMTPSADGLVYTVEMSVKQGEEFKIRANGAWNGINFGGNLSGGQAVVGSSLGAGEMWWDGPNFKAPKTGKITIKLDLTAYPYTLTVE